MRVPLISIIITNFNAYQWLDRCLGSIKQQKFSSYEVIFVDDGSTDGSYEYVQKKFSWCVCIKNTMNVGFAMSNNIGARAARGTYLFFLNADTYLEKDTLVKLAKAMYNNPAYTLAQLDIRKYDKSNMNGQACTFTIDRFGYPIWSGREDTIFYADAAAMVIKSAVFKELGGFDERFYIYLEDLDLSWRARICGYSVHFIPKVYAYHYAGGTSVSTHAKGKTYTTTVRRRFDAQKNNLCTILKNVELKNLIWMVPGSVLLASAEGFLYLLKGNVGGFFALHNAIMWNILNIAHTRNKRSAIQKRRTVADKEIFKHIDARISKLASFFSYGIPHITT